MAAASDGEKKIMFPGEAYPGDNVLDPRALRDHCGALVDQAVPNPPRPIIALASLAYESATKLSRERLQGFRTWLGGFATDGSEGRHAQPPDLMAPIKALDAAV
jgi:hypothetical protein